MATHELSQHFASFFRTVTPRRSFEQAAAREQAAVTDLTENQFGPTGDLIAPASNQARHIGADC
jgi:hypothetical protein